MTVSTDPSTFEYTQNWLASSDCFVRDAMGIATVDPTAAREEAKLRVHCEESLAEPNEEEEDEHDPDLPPPVDARPLAIVISKEDSRHEAGTGSWSGRGRLFIGVEVLVPEEYRADHNATAAEKATTFKARKQWARRLCNTIRLELLVTKGQGDAAGNRYLNARDVDIEVFPGDPEEGEDSTPDRQYIAWAYEVPWVG